MSKVESKLSSSLKNCNPCTIELGFVTLNKIHELNREFRKVDRPTDVLSFKAAPMPLIKGQPIVIGEIIISPQIAKSQAKEYGHSFDREIAFLIVHGFLHLMGMDHKTKKDAEKMEAQTEKILSELNLTR